jgi:hypothetical protein
MGASVKVMLSYDYCHFEISKSTDEDISNNAIDELRKDCMRLADKAIEQYKIAKAGADIRLNRKCDYDKAMRDVERINAKAEADRTVGEIATVKAFNDKNWKEYISQQYNYEDDFEWND